MSSSASVMSCLSINACFEIAYMKQFDYYNNFSVKKSSCILVDAVTKLSLFVKICSLSNCLEKLSLSIL